MVKLYSPLDNSYVKAYDLSNMSITSDIKTYTASEAREKLYTLIKAASTGLESFEITLRGSNPVIIINKAELESWQETLDILSNKKEICP